MKNSSMLLYIGGSRLIVQSGHDVYIERDGEESAVSIARTPIEDRVIDEDMEDALLAEDALAEARGEMAVASPIDDDERIAKDNDEFAEPIETDSPDQERISRILLSMLRARQGMPVSEKEILRRLKEVFASQEDTHLMRIARATEGIQRNIKMWSIPHGVKLPS